jgi:hypothetical protein
LNWSVPDDIRLVGSNHATSMQIWRLTIVFFNYVLLFV